MLARGIKWCDVRSSNPSRYLFQETTEKIPKRRQRKKKVQREIFRRARETRRRREKTTPQEWSSQGRAVYRLPALCVRASVITSGINALHMHAFPSVGMCCRSWACLHCTTLYSALGRAFAQAGNKQRSNSNGVGEGLGNICLAENVRNILGAPKIFLHSA